MVITADEIEFKSNVYRSNAFEFVYLDFYPFRANKLYQVLYTKDKHQIWIDMRGKRLLPIGYHNNTIFNKYRKAKNGKLKREVYLKSFTYQLTLRQRRKGSILRYFAQYVFDQDETIFEIRKSDYKQETLFYKKVSLPWQLKGSKESVRMNNEVSLERAESLLQGMQNFLDPLEFYEEEITPYEEIQEKLGRLKFPPESTDTSSNQPPPPPPGGGGGSVY